MVRAKFRVDRIVDNNIFMSVTYEDPSLDTENAKFTKATPWGICNLGIDNPKAIEQFEVGKYYYADFSPA